MKLYQLLLLLILSLSLSFTLKAEVGEDKSENSHLSTLPKSVKILWQKIGGLPAPEGFSESIGISGAYSGLLGDYLIVAGGANFPNGHPFFQQGQKVFYSDIFVFDVSSDKLKLVSRGHLPIKAGHGSTLLVDNSLYLVGGKNSEQALDSIIKLTLDASQSPQVEVLGKLPFTWESGGAAWQDNSLYTFAGKQNGQVSNLVCKYSFQSSTCVDTSVTPPLPGVSRTDFPALSHDGHFYIFGGLNFNVEKDNVALTDAYRFNFKKAQWQTLAPITLEEEPFAVAGGGAAVLSNDQIVLLGGVNRAVFDHAVGQLTRLKGEDLRAFKQEYFSLSKADINFSRHQIVYNISDNFWTKLTDKVPFSGGAGPVTISQQDNNIFWISGEIKPVIRSPNVYQGKF